MFCLGLVLSVAAWAVNNLDEKTRRIHRKATVVDTHSDTTQRLLDENFDMGMRSSTGHMDIPRMKEGGLDAEFFSIWVDPDKYIGAPASKRALDLIDAVYEQAKKHPEALEMAYSAEDIRRLKKQGKIGALMGVEGGHAIDDDLRVLRTFYRLGVRYMTLTHTKANNWADSSTDTPKHNGLTDFGREVVREMNRLGMIVDISHVSDKTFYDTLAVSKAPVIASHSSCRALCDHPRNMTDDMIRALAKNGGVMQINFFPAFISNKYREASANLRKQLEPEIKALEEKYKDDPAKLAEERRALMSKYRSAAPLPTLDDLVAHIDHVVKLVGPDYVGLGSDFDGVPTLPIGMEDCSKLPAITKALLEKGYNEKDITKILGGNLLRVFDNVAEVAKAMK
jgi:membrane dipeptidase